MSLILVFICYNNITNYCWYHTILCYLYQKNKKYIYNILSWVKSLSTLKYFPIRKVWRYRLSFLDLRLLITPLYCLSFLDLRLLIIPLYCLSFFDLHLLITQLYCLSFFDLHLLITLWYLQTFLIGKYLSVDRLLTHDSIL
jgi:hypothetical protein